MLTTRQIAAINRVRELLRDVEKLTYSVRGQEYGAGRLAEACHEAEAALLNVLLCARHYMGGANITEEILRGEEE